MMKIIKECGKSILGFLAFLAAFIVFALIDERLGYWLTDHSLTRAMLNFAIVGVAMLVMRLLKSDLSSYIVADMGVLIFAESFDNGYSFILPITMMIWLYIVDLTKKGGAE
jgi:hypothetical protein